jgi:hypothetical protein
MADYAALQAIVSTTEQQLASVQSQKASLVTLLQTLIASNAPDIGSVSSAGGEGSESYTAQTLTEKIEQLARVEQMLTDTLREQKVLAAQSGPGIIRPRGCGRPW